MGNIGNDIALSVKTCCFVKCLVDTILRSQDFYFFRRRWSMPSIISDQRHGEILNARVLIIIGSHSIAILQLCFFFLLFRR